MIPVRDTTLRRGFAPVTSGIVLLNILLFIETLRQGEILVQRLGVSPLDIYIYLTQGTGSIFAIHLGIMISGFMHGGYVHLLGNLLFLSVFGPALEKRIGRRTFFLFYLLSIFVAFYSHVLVHPHSPLPLVGASGAIAAVMGAYLVFFPCGKILTILPLIFMIEIVEIPSVIFMLVWLLLQSANGYLSIGSTTSVAWFSHIGGFIMGLFMAIKFRWFP
ncbi:MAG TPA: rhomboid family intramembrane serine protease [Deltaproteobacteria bacterium]|nr:rhomboid family intramembrane serine protease [Deltaproteobacteria bacterium]